MHETNQNQYRIGHALFVIEQLNFHRGKKHPIIAKDATMQ